MQHSALCATARLDRDVVNVESLESARCSVHAARWTLDQAVNFVLSNLELMRGGEIFVPKLEKTSIVQLVRILARREDFPLKITAIRPGERMRPIAKI